MNCKRRRTLLLVTAVAAAGLYGWAIPLLANDATDRQPQQRAVAVTIEETQAESHDAGQPTQLRIKLDAVQPGKYWIGVVCSPLEDELLKTHLGLAHGILVTEVIKDGPAAQAGLQPQDILVAVDKKPLTDLKVLVDSTQEAQSKVLTLTLIRRGKRLEAKVTPTQRPATYSITPDWPDHEAAAEWKMLQEALRGRGYDPQSQTEDSSQTDHTSMMFVMPGFVLPDKEIDFPRNLEVTVTKKGEAAATVTVRRGDDEWVVDADSLDQLPADIRPHVQRMLGQGLSITVEGDVWNWPTQFPKPLVVPEILKKSLKVLPGDAPGVLEISPEVHFRLGQKIQERLEDVDKKLQKSPSRLPAEALKNMQRELQTLREQLEQLRAARDQQAAEQEDADDNP